MDVGLGWLGVGVGAAGTVATLLLASASVTSGEQRARSGERRGAWPAALLTAVLTLVFWGISLRAEAPFSAGQTLGWGFLIGGLLGAIAVLAVPRFDALGSAGSVRTRYLLACCSSFYALMGASLAYGVFHGYPQDALIGFAIGAVMAAVLARSVLASDVYVDLWSIFAVLISVGTVLAVLHFDVSTERTWWTLPILLATTVCVTGYVGIEIGSARGLFTRPGASFVLSAFAASVLLLALSAVYAWKIVGDWQLLGVVGAGVIVAAVIAWLAAGAARSTDGVRVIEAGAASAVLVIALVVAAFKLWGGLGIALSLVGSWSFLLSAMGLARIGRPESLSVNMIPPALRWALVFGLTVVLFRLFLEYYRSDLSTTDLRIHYTFVGAVLGFIMPLLFSSWLMRLRSGLAAIALVGLLAAASPLVVFVLWGVKAAMGFLFGLVLSAASGLAGSSLWVPFLSSRPNEPGTADTNHWIVQFGAQVGTCAPLILGAQLTAIQFVGPLMTIEDTRMLRIWVLTAVVVLGIIWLVLGDVIDRKTAR